MKVYIIIGVLLGTYACLSQAKDSEGEGRNEARGRPQCCPYKNGMTIDLKNGKYTGSVEGVSAPVFQSQASEHKCSYMANLHANFQNLPAWIKRGCTVFPMCDRRMLRIDMYLGDERSGYMFNVGDSPSNDAWGGDSSHTQHDAEIFGYNAGIYQYKSDFCQSETTSWANALLAPDVKRVTIYIGNNHARITNDNGLDVSGCSKCLFALDGQDPNDLSNTLHMAFNRVIRASSGRKGTGVCGVRIRWECPDCDRSIASLPIKDTYTGEE